MTDLNQPIPQPLDPRRRRLVFRAQHRGTFENDLLIGDFVKAHIVDFSETELTALESILNLPDPDLADWLTGRAPLPADASPMLHRLREAALSRYA